MTTEWGTWSGKLIYSCEYIKSHKFYEDELQPKKHSRQSNSSVENTLKKYQITIDKLLKRIDTLEKTVMELQNGNKS